MCFRFQREELFNEVMKFYLAIRDGQGGKFDEMN